MKTRNPLSEGSSNGKQRLPENVVSEDLLRIRERNRVHILEQLAGDQSISAIMLSIVRSIEEEDIDSICTILQYDKLTNTLGHGVGPGMPQFYHEAIDGSTIGDGLGSCGTAAFRGELVVVEDIGTHPYWALFKELAFQAGVRSCWSQPILSGKGDVVGTFAIYHKEPRTPNQVDLDRIAYAARFANLAIENRRNREEVLRHRDQLELLVAERTKELTYANEDLERFAHIIAHDLRSPIASCVQLVQLVQVLGENLSDEMKETLGMLTELSQNMTNTIEGVYQYTVLDSQNDFHELVDLTKAAEEALRNLKTKVNECGAIVKIEPMPKIQANHVQIVQLFQNLMGNGIKYRGDKIPELLVKSYNGVGEVIVSVTDNGIGIAKENHKKIFEVFGRLHTSASEYEGVGMGLTIVKRVIDRHKGRIWIESELGKGTSFFFALKAE